MSAPLHFPFLRLLACGVLCGLVIGPAAPPAAAQQSEENTGIHTIAGNVETPDGSVVRVRFEVTLTRMLGGSGRIREASDLGGRFQFRGVGPGRYRVEVKSLDVIPYEDSSTEVEVERSRNPQYYSVTVVLKPKPGAPRPSGDARTVSVSESSIPKDAKKAFEKGVSAAQNGKTEEAILKFQEALKISPKYVSAMTELGMQYMRLKRFEESVAVLREAVDLEPASFQPRLNLAVVLFASGRVMDASPHITQALQLEPRSPVALLFSGRIERQLGHNDAALDAFKRAYSAGGPKMAIAELELAALYETSGMREEAIKAYKTYLTHVSEGQQADFARTRLKGLKDK
jgi:hypothetical protein